MKNVLLYYDFKTPLPLLIKTPQKIPCDAQDKNEDLKELFDTFRDFKPFPFNAFPQLSQQWVLQSKKNNT